MIIKKTLRNLTEFSSHVEWRIAIKTGIAASLSLFFGVGFSKVMEHPANLISGTWCVMSTFVVMQAHLGGTYQAAWVRFLGVMIGSIMGAFFTFTFGSDVLSLGLSVVCTILACSFFNLKESVRIACLSVSIVNILWGMYPDVSPFRFALFRFLDSVLGILIAVIVAHTVWPSEATGKMRLHIIRTLDTISRFYRNTLHKEGNSKDNEKSTKQSVKEIWHLLKQDRAFLEESRLEMLTRTQSIEAWNLLIDTMAKVFQSIQKLHSLPKTKILATFDDKLKKSLNNLTEQTEIAFQTIAKQLQSREEKDLAPLSHAVEAVNDDLKRFLSSKKNKEKTSFQDMEPFFLFFYNLRYITEELVQLQESVNKLNNPNR